MKRNASLFLPIALLMTIAFSSCLAEPEETGNTASAPHDTAGSRSVGPEAQPRHPHCRLHGRGETARKGGREEFVFSIDTE